MKTMTTRAKRSSDSEQYSDEGEDKERAEGDEDIEDEEQDDVETQACTKRKIGAGSDMVHMLPIQFNAEHNASVKASVDAYFEPFIKENEFKAKDSNFCNYTSTLRGHPLNGKKLQNVSGLTYCQLLKDSSGVYEVNHTKPIKEYFLWQYDEVYAGSNPLNNIQQTMTKLDLLS